MWVGVDVRNVRQVGRLVHAAVQHGHVVTPLQKSLQYWDAGCAAPADDKRFHTSSAYLPNQTAIGSLYNHTPGRLGHRLPDEGAVVVQEGHLTARRCYGVGFRR
ncbi:hypothetical protein MTY59_19000 [Mycobacterium senriense]|uniref:Uncharacterized protein n=1 Tax=Mycobacterium senriense TaxID=2775496 RepID=A0ABN6IE45_9MYCO|nr:hypothetical protein MTY59_19000 [Mycobacterium senriense]